MSFGRKPQPRWNKEATDQAKALSEDVRENVRKIAVRFARHEQCESVTVRHVDEAYFALCRSGLKRWPIWKRPSAEIGLGTFLFGLTFGVPDMMSLALDSQAKGFRVACIAAILALIASGGAFVVHGWYRDQL
ncbi:MAG: hypothetical protein MI757_09680 [Pirellulales bacterium]|nr:hypothetical protein [Pirellulales bacterium]